MLVIMKEEFMAAQEAFKGPAYREGEDLNDFVVWKGRKDMQHKKPQHIMDSQTIRKKKCWEIVFCWYLNIYVKILYVYVFIIYIYTCFTESLS